MRPNIREAQLCWTPYKTECITTGWDRSWHNGRTHNL